MSDKTAAQKLLIKEGYKILILNAPTGYTSQMGELPPKVMLLTKPETGADLIQIFLKSHNEMEAQLPPLGKLLKPGGLLWIIYPKRTSKTPADINRDTIQQYAAGIGLTAVALVAVDETWSALRLKAA